MKSRIAARMRAVVGGDLAVAAIQKEVERFPGVVDAAGEVRRCHAGPGQVILQLQPDFVGFRQAGRQQLLAYRVGNSHGCYSPSVSSRTMSSMKSGRAAVCRSCGRIRVGWWRLLVSRYFGSILQVSDLATISGTSPYAGQASNVICDRLTSRAPDPHRSSNVFVANRSARDQLLGPQPPQEPAVQIQGDGFTQIGWVARHQDISFDLQKQLGQTLAIGWFVALTVQLHTSALRHLAPLTVPEQGIENFRTLNQSSLSRAAAVR